MTSPWSKEIIKSTPSLESPSPLPSPLDYQFCVLSKTYHADEMLKFSTYDHIRTK